MKKKLGLWLLGCCLSSSIAPSYAADDAPTLTYSWPTNAGPLDPRGYSPNQMYAQAMVYEPLVRYTRSGQLEPWLATHWTVSADGKTYTFTLIAKVLYGLEPRADALFSNNLPYTDLGLKALGFDRQQARERLQTAGWTLPPGKTIREKDGQPLSVELVFLGTSALQKSLAEIIQGELAKVGMQVQSRAEEDGALVQRQREGRFGMIFADTWGAPYDPHSFVSSMRYAGHADYMAQRGLPMKDAIDRKIAQILGETREKQRAEGYRDILTTLHEQAVYLPISYLTAISVSRPTVDNVQFGSTLFDVPFDVMRPASRKP